MKYLLQVLCLAILLLKPSESAPASSGLSDPDKQPKFTTIVPNPLDPSFIFNTTIAEAILVSVSIGVADVGLVGSDGTTPVQTPIWGYGTEELGYTWPGRTFEVQSEETLKVDWRNNIPIADGYILTGINNFTEQSVVDTSYHWAFSIPGYEDFSIEQDGTPIVPHLHGGHTDAAYDGNPEYFFTPNFEVRGPRWHAKTFVYDNRQPASCLWYHDHALGITRLNVYTGLAGFYILRDQQDTGKQGNPLNLPAFPYELPLLIQDRMFKETGELFYPAFPGDPYYADFITDEGAAVSDDEPSALAEFFGDHMTVNGKIWPKAEVEPRHYRLRLLNGCDSRFLVVELFVVDLNQTSFENAERITFEVIGGDQGLATSAKTVEKMVIHPSARYDVIVDFTQLQGRRVVMKNTGGDEPFGGDIPGPQVFSQTDKVMAFDVTLAFDANLPDTYEPESSTISKADFNILPKANNVRRVGLFEGHDQYGRLQPLLGTIDPAIDMNGNPIYWPSEEPYLQAGVQGQMSGTMTWHAPTTENIKLGDVEDWEIWNLSADAHPIHLHLVKFQLVSRREIIFDSLASESGEVEPGEATAGDGTYTIDATLVQHDGTIGEGYRVVNPTAGAEIDPLSLPEYIDTVPLDSVVALPGQITTIRAKFDKPGRFNWHCHILAHEDHEMMRLFHVGLLPPEQRGGAETQQPSPENEEETDGSHANAPIHLTVPSIVTLCATMAVAFFLW